VLLPSLTLDVETGAKATLAAAHVVTAGICAFVISRSVRPSSA
jgi:HAMP domain-containing protein